MPDDTDDEGEVPTGASSVGTSEIGKLAVWPVTTLITL
jgi:hypothetical protein